MASPTDPIQPVQSVLQQAGAVTPADVSQGRMVTATLSTYDFDGPVPGREGCTYAGKKRDTKPYIIKLTSSMTFGQLDHELRVALQRLGMADILPPNTRGQFRSIHVMESTKSKNFMRVKTAKKATKVMKVLDWNWEACRDLLLKNESYTLQLDMWQAPPGWDWHRAMWERRTGRKALQCPVQ